MSFDPIGRDVNTPLIRGYPPNAAPLRYPVQPRGVPVAAAVDPRLGDIANAFQPKPSNSLYEVGEPELQAWERFLSERMPQSVLSQAETFSEQEEKNDRERYLEKLESLQAYAACVRTKNSLSVIPGYIGNVSWSKNYVQITDQMTHWRAPNSKLAFGSRDSYMQGVDLPFSPEKKGNLENVFVLEMSISMVKNPYPYPIGIRLVHTIKDSEGPEKTVIFPYADVVFRDTEFHAVIPAGMNTTNNDTQVRLYHSRVDINHPWGKRFPNTTHTTLEKENWNRDNVRVEETSPVLHHIIEQAMLEQPRYLTSLPPARLPPDSEHAEGRESYRIKRDEYNAIETEVRRLIQERIPVVDMNTFQIHVEHLTGAEQSRWRDPPNAQPATRLEFLLHSEIAFRESATRTQDVVPIEETPGYGAASANIF